MLQCVPDAVLVYLVGDIMGGFLGGGAGVAHGDGGADGGEHVHIVLPVTEGHGFAFFDAVVRKDFGDAGGFAALCGDAVCAAHVPAGEFDPRHGGQGARSWSFM